MVYMTKKSPKTEKGKIRKAWTGDGRRRTPDEEFGKMLKDTNKAMGRTMRETSEIMRGQSSGKKKK